MGGEILAIAEQVRSRVRREGIDLATDAAATERYVADAVRAYSERAFSGVHDTLVDEAETSRAVVASLTGFGPLQPLLDDGVNVQAFATTASESLLRAMARVEQAGYQNTARVLSPLDFALFELKLNTGGDYRGNRAPAEPGPRSVWCVPVVRSPALTEGLAAVGDFSRSSSGRARRCRSPSRRPTPTTS